MLSKPTKGLPSEKTNSSGRPYEASKGAQNLHCKTQSTFLGHYITVGRIANGEIAAVVDDDSSVDDIGQVGEGLGAVNSQLHQKAAGGAQAIDGQGVVAAGGSKLITVQRLILDRGKESLIEQD